MNTDSEISILLSTKFWYWVLCLEIIKEKILKSKKWKEMGKSHSALCVCGLPNAGPCVCSLENSPPFSDLMSSSSTPNNFLLLELSCLVGDKFQLFPMVLLHPWKTLALPKVGSASYPLSAYNSIHCRCPHPHIPATVSLCLRVFCFCFFVCLENIPSTGRGGGSDRDWMPSREQLSTVTDGS